MSTENHPDDQSAIEKLHVEFINRFDRVNDDLMVFQDKAYAMGRARGLLDAERQVGELRESLRSMTLGYRDAISNGHDRIIFLGGDCDSPGKMLADNPSYAKALTLLDTTSTEGKDHD